ncbi:BTB/POZ domain-containing protein [Canna indica]|uniref:BTB/POZ domain-containing protein n=1 Tax=Canna indica TaxID=4628 RepID=A0AAQ3KR95_9LILI|nr:BTB/POZ domain-containing protein [Canna indica]
MTCDLEVHVNGEKTFLVDKEALPFFCSKLKQLVSNSSLITPSKKPLRVNDDKKDRTQMNPTTITCLSLGSVNFAEMSGEISSSTSLVKMSGGPIKGIPYWPWPEVVSVLKQCQDSAMLDKLMNSLVERITTSDNAATPTSSSPENSAFRFSCDTGSTISAKNSGSHQSTWWFEDLVALNPDMIEKIVKNMVVQKANHVLISRFLMYYLKNASSEKKKVAKVVTDLLYSLDESSVSCKGLFGVLRILSSLKTSQCSQKAQNKLERMIGKKFDQATLDNLLVPTLSGKDSLYDVNLVLRFLKHFVSSSEVCESVTRLKLAGGLLDSYLAEVAPDSSLKPLKFLALVTSLPDEARDSYDSIYRAIDMYLEVHNQLSDEEKTEICSVINYEKLSSESFKHLAINTKFPSRTVIGALISQQRKLRSLLEETNQFKNYKENQIHDDEQIVLYAKKLDLSMENEKLKSQLRGMQTKLMELEKICNKMKRQTAKVMKTKVSRSSGSRTLPRLC